MTALLLRSLVVARHRLCLPGVAAPQSRHLLPVALKLARHLWSAVRLLAHHLPSVASPPLRLLSLVALHHLHHLHHLMSVVLQYFRHLSSAA